MKDQAFRFTGDAPKNYDQYLGPLLFEPYAKDIAARVPKTAEAVLELACGTGRVTKHLRSRIPLSSRIIATDVSADMIDVAKERLKDATIDFRVADACNLSFPDNSFDAIVCQFGFMFFPDRMKAVHEALRVLRPGGTFLFNTWDKTNAMPLLSLIYDDNINLLFSDEDLVSAQLPFSLHDPIQLQSYLEGGGFKNIGVFHVILKGNAPTPADVVTGFLLKHSIRKSIEEKDPTAVPALAKQIQEQVEKRFGTPVETDLSAFVVSGVKG